MGWTSGLSPSLSWKVGFGFGLGLSERESGGVVGVGLEMAGKKMLHVSEED